MGRAEEGGDDGVMNGRREGGGGEEGKSDGRNGYSEALVNWLEERMDRWMDE